MKNVLKRALFGAMLAGVSITSAYAAGSGANVSFQPFNAAAAPFNKDYSVIFEVLKPSLKGGPATIVYTQVLEPGQQSAAASTVFLPDARDAFYDYQFRAAKTDNNAQVQNVWCSYNHKLDLKNVNQLVFQPSTSINPHPCITD